jgi:hypothetical protein
VRLILTIIFLLGSLTLAQAETLWTHWIGGTLVPPFVSGTVNGQAITFSGTGTILSAQSGLPGQPVYWTPQATYTGGPVTNPPITSDVIRLVGPGTYTITFAQPVTNPVMAVLSLGGIAPASFDFGIQPFTILTSGPGFFGAVRQPLAQVGNVLSGWEAYGVIQFAGTLTTLTFTMPVAENWTGFTIGVPVGLVPPIPEPPSSPALVNAELRWDYTATDELSLVNGGFRLYEGLGLACDLPDPLPTQIESLLPAASRAYNRIAIPAGSDRACYEISAFNDVGESARSNRASVMVVELVPAQPTGVTITSLVGP